MMFEGNSAVKSVPALNDNVFQALYGEESDPETSAMCVQALEMICYAILHIPECQCHDQLPGGKYWQPAPSLKSHCQCTQHEPNW